MHTVCVCVYVYVYVYVCTCTCVCVWDVFHEVLIWLVDWQAHLYDHFPLTTSCMSCLKATVPAHAYKCGDSHVAISHFDATRPGMRKGRSKLSYFGELRAWVTGGTRFAHNSWLLPFFCIELRPQNCNSNSWVNTIGTKLIQSVPNVVWSTYDTYGLPIHTTHINWANISTGSTYY